MPARTYAQNKESILKWRVNNRGAFNEYSRIYQRINYNDQAREKKRLYYLKKKAEKENRRMIEESGGLVGFSSSPLPPQEQEQITMIIY